MGRKVSRLLVEEALVDLSVAVKGVAVGQVLLAAECVSRDQRGIEPNRTEPKTVTLVRIA